MVGSNLAYAATRARVRRSKLLKPEAYRHLLAMEVVEITRYITELDYREDVDRYASRYRGVDLIGIALSSNLRRNLAEVLSFCKGDLYQLIDKYLERYRIRDLKHVIRGVNAELSQEKILDDMVTTQEQDRRFFRRLAACEDLADLADQLAGSPYYPAVGDLLRKELSSLQEVEDTLDRFFYRRLLETVQPTSKANRMLLTFIRREIDVVNLQTITRLRHRNIPGYSELMIPGGEELSVDILAACNSLVDLITAVEKTHIGKAVTEALQAVEGQGLNPLVQALKVYMATGAKRFSRLYPISVLPVLDYLLHKEYEVANLRALARGKHLGLPTRDIQELLVVL